MTTTPESSPDRSIPPRSRGAWGVLRTFLAALFILTPFTFAPVALAQDPTPPTPPPVTSPGEIRLGVEAFGVGNRARAGDWAALRVKLFDSAVKQRDIVLSISGPDADGDSIAYQRAITSNPNVWQAVWLYARLPFALSPAGPWTLSAYEALEDPAAVGGFRAGRLLGRTKLAANAAGSIVEPFVGMFAVMGNARLGLDPYSKSQSPRELWSPGRHEITEIVSGLTPADLPDRWMGLAAFECLVWGSGEISELRGERARALREWVERGGHLIIILPSVGQTWSNPQSNELHDIMPVVTITRREGVDMEPLRHMLTRATDVALPKDAVLQTFAPLPDAAPAEAMRLMDTPAGECVVVRRLVGVGAVTLVGLDLSRSQFSQGASLQTDVFWHRLLGRRGLLTTASAKNAANFMRSPVDIDQDIAATIAKSGRSGEGLLLGFVLFAAYWLLAGPLGFAILKSRGHTRHAWLVFLLVGLGFTAIAWTGATALRPNRIEGTHLTLLDHVFGQNVQRTRSWMGVLIPKYGNGLISVGEDDAQAGATGPAGRRSWNLVAPWESLSSAEAGSITFPDTRPYAVDARAPDRILVPARATVKEIQADWAGPPRWDMPHPVATDTGPSTLRIVPGGQGKPDKIVGALVHNLPGSLREVTIIVVTGQTAFSTGGAEFTPRGFWLQVQSAWRAGDTLDLEVLQAGAAADPASSAANLDLYLNLRSGLSEKLLATSLISNTTASGAKLLERLRGISLYSAIAPAEALNATLGSTVGVARRSATHAWDLSRWFSQPCVIVLGYLDDAKSASADPRVSSASPTPVFVDGKPVATRGLTFVRWVYPLATNPPRFLAKEPDPKPQPDPDPNAGPNPEPK